MNSINISPTIDIKPLDALWALFKNQPKSVRIAFTRRLLSEDPAALAEAHRMTVSQSLKQAVKELNEAHKDNYESLLDAYNLFK